MCVFISVCLCIRKCVFKSVYLKVCYVCYVCVCVCVCVCVFKSECVRVCVYGRDERGGRCVRGGGSGRVGVVVGGVVCGVGVGGERGVWWPRQRVLREGVLVLRGR